MPPDQYDIAHMMGAKIVSEWPRLRELLTELNRPPIYFNLMSKFHRHDCLIYEYQAFTLQMVSALRSLAPEGHGFCNEFREIVQAGTGREFQLDDNNHWLQRVAPIVQAFLHARCLLEMAVQCVELTGLPNQFSFLGVAMLMNLFEPGDTLDIE